MDEEKVSSSCPTPRVRRKIVSHRKKTTVRKMKQQPSPLPHPDNRFWFMIIMYSILHQVTQQHQKTEKKMLGWFQEIMSVVASNKVETCKLQGPMSIGNLQICGRDGCNNLTINNQENQLRHESSNPSPAMGNEWEARYSSPGRPYRAQTAENPNTCFSCDSDKRDGLNWPHFVSKNEMSQTKQKKHAGVGFENVQCDQHDPSNGSYDVADCSQHEGGCLGIPCDVESAASQHEQGGVVAVDATDGDGIGHDGEKQKMKGYERSQVCHSDDDGEVCLSDSDIDNQQFYQAGQGDETDQDDGGDVSGKDDLSDIDEGGVVCGLPGGKKKSRGKEAKTDQGVTELCRSSLPEVLFSKHKNLSVSEECSQSIVSECIPQGQGSAVKALPVVDDGSNQGRNAATEMSEGSSADSSVPPQPVEKFGARNTEAIPVPPLNFHPDADSETGFGAESNAKAGMGTCADVPGLTTSQRKIFSGFGVSLTNVNGRQSKKMKTQDGESVGMTKLCGECKGSCLHDSSNKASLPYALQGSDFELVINGSKSVRRSGDFLGPVLISFDKAGSGRPFSADGPDAAEPSSAIEQPLPATVFDRTQAGNGMEGTGHSLPATSPSLLQINKALPASRSHPVKTGMSGTPLSDSTLADNEIRAMEKPHSPTYFRVDDVMTTANESVGLTLSEPKQIADSPRRPGGSVAATSCDAAQTGGGYGVEESDKSQKMGFSGPVDGTDEPAGGKESKGSFPECISDHVVDTAKERRGPEGCLPVLSHCMPGEYGFNSPSLPLPVQAVDDTEVDQPLSFCLDGCFGNDEDC